MISKPADTSNSCESHIVYSGDQVMEVTTWPYAKTPVKAPPMPIASHKVGQILPAPFSAKVDAVLSKTTYVSDSAECHYVFSGDQVMAVTTWPYAPSPLKEAPTKIDGSALTHEATV